MIYLIGGNDNFVQIQAARSLKKKLELNDLNVELNFSHSFLDVLHAARSAPKVIGMVESFRAPHYDLMMCHRGVPIGPPEKIVPMRVVYALGCARSKGIAYYRVKPLRWLHGDSPMAFKVCVGLRELLDELNA